MDAYVEFTLKNAAVIDRIYFKGAGTANVAIYVQYEGDDDYTMLSYCGGVDDYTASPFAKPDTTKKIVRVKILEQNPPQGTSLWQEVVFARVEEE